ncbi:ATP-binding protein [Hoeflea sp.]|uniref:sensor histidine kinase n=1 Tax=Hoeflea sp. TaxID=1940281 RepID=UPI00374919B3
MLDRLLGGKATSSMMFRYGFVFVAFMTVAVFIVAAINYQIIRKAMLDELHNQILEETILMENIAVREGPLELSQIKFLNEPENIISTRIFALFNAKGERLAGNLKQLPQTTGWFEQSFQGLHPEPNGRYLIFHERFPDGTSLAIGRSLTPSHKVLTTISWLIVATVLFLAAIGLLTIYLASKNTYRKIASLTDTLDRVTDGDLKARIPVGTGSDQLDRASRAINLQLDRLQKVIETNSYTIEAIAHDLRSPLNRVSLLLQEITATENIETIEESLKNASDEVANLTDIFDTTLRISKLSAGTADVEFSRIAVSGLIEDLAELFSPVVEDAGDFLKVDVARALDAEILGDVRMVKQLLVNLIENAANHCPEATTIFLRAETMPDGKTLIEVTDNGPGIPEAFRDTVLQPFKRLDASRTKAGTGLGLALVAAIAGRHGATVTLGDNNPGLIVSLLFPAIKTDPNLSNL